MPHTCKARHVCITWATSTSWGPVSQLFPFMLSTIAQKWTLEGLHFSYWQMWKLTWDSHITWWNHVHKLITVFTNIPIWSIIVIISPSLCDPGDGGKFDDFKLSSANSCLPPPPSPNCSDLQSDWGMFSTDCLWSYFCAQFSYMLFLFLFNSRRTAGNNQMLMKRKRGRLNLT